MTSAAPISLVVLSVQPTAELIRLRAHAAVIRALVEELDHLVPSANRNGELAIGSQLVEELMRRGERILACVRGMDPPTDGSSHFASDPNARRISGAKDL